MRLGDRAVLKTWATMRGQEWECPWNFILVLLQVAIFFLAVSFYVGFFNAITYDENEISLLLRDIHYADLYLGLYEIALVLMLVCFRLVVGTVPQPLRLSLAGFGKEFWLAAFLVVLIKVLALLSVFRVPASLPSAMHLLDLSVMKMFQLVVAVPLLEEWLFRGILYPYLRKHVPVVWAIMANAVLFALCHYTPQKSFWVLLSHLGVGLVFVIYYERSRSIGACVALHGLANMIPAVALCYRAYG